MTKQTFYTLKMNKKNGFATLLLILFSLFLSASALAADTYMYKSVQKFNDFVFGYTGHASSDSGWEQEPADYYEGAYVLDEPDPSLSTTSGGGAGGSFTLRKPACGAYGDANLDGYVSGIDTELILSSAVGSVSFDADKKLNSDVNNDDLVNAADAQIVAAYVAGTRDSVTVCDEARRSPCGNFGDIDSDGLITEYDANIILKHSVGNTKISLSSLALYKADVNGDGKVDIFDSLRINKYAAKSVDTFDVCTVKEELFPDIAVISLLRLDSPVKDDFEHFKSVIKNIGDATSQAISVSTKFECSGYGGASGGSSNDNFVLGPEETYTHQFKFALEGTCVVAVSAHTSDDSNKSNNQRSINVDVGKPKIDADFSISEFYGTTHYPEITEIKETVIDAKKSVVMTAVVTNNYHENASIRHDETYAYDDYRIEYSCGKNTGTNAGTIFGNEPILPWTSKSFQFKCIHTENGRDRASVEVIYSGDRDDSNNRRSFPFYVVYPLEEKALNRLNYFVLGGKHLMQYRGVNKVTADLPTIKFRDEVNYDELERPINSKGGGTINIGGRAYAFKAASGADIRRNDYPINIDLNGDGVIGVPATDEIISEIESIIMSEGQTKTITVEGKKNKVTYKITSDFIRSTGIALTINGETTPEIEKKGTYTLLDHTKITVDDTLIQNFAGGVKRVEFHLTLPKQNVKLITMSEGDKRVIAVSGKKYEYDTFVDYIGSEGAKLTINTENTSLLREGDSYKLNDETIITVETVSISANREEASRKVTFYFTTSVKDVPDPIVEPLSGRIKLYSGWNLVNFFGIISPHETKVTCDENKVLGAFFYDPIANEYVDLISGRDTFKDYFVDYLIVSKINSLWINVAEGCTIDYTIPHPYGWLAEIEDSRQKLAAGWNMISIIPEMRDFKIDDFKGTCSVNNAFGWIPDQERWTNLRDITLDEDYLVGYGFAINVANECVLSPGDRPAQEDLRLPSFPT